MRFDLTDLRLFLLVVEAGSITHGATQANMTLPSASARLRGMEDVIGLPLLERGRRGVATTPAGDAVAHHARIVLRQIEQMRGELGEFSKGLKSHIRLMANTAAMTEFLPERLAAFLAVRPNVDIDLKERLSTEIVKAVAGGSADIGVITDAVDHGNLELRPFAIDRLVLVVARSSQWAGHRHIAFADVAGQEFVGLSAGSPLQDYLGDHAARAGHALAFRIRLRTFEGICRMVAQNVGLGIVPETAAKRYRRSMPIHSVRLTDSWATRHLAICARRFEDLHPHARELVEQLAMLAPAHGSGRV
ncbi:DNA-binding transcriptional LysR family regulator [Phyllobacterium myrsinacearum]|uniref:LysR family transcriptional regulator n=2 Tax=Phyllobacterium myrsinacearum TaxID=28101 RepID=A0A2S9JHI9_9HYPH|nr:LysR family transcriptional regulator [Phyllobacterium myrsinacearum]PRD52452.1 LysR family transcriptional regulator [Phyllobacterium myrsinacearum]PWV92175.1 DNA-binding transcriptional LysR family regulator [Phyllobacterium myrsinacearum]RZV05016.1 DNA-binding transcriptional LysR family regulator [Phyllobacterium myrsinacearum]